MHTRFLNMDLGEVEFTVLISFVKCLRSFELALQHFVVETGAVNVFVHRPVAEDVFKVLEVHPEDSIIVVTIETDLMSELVCPEW